MAVILPNSCFIRVPRTGSTFVKDVLKAMGLHKGDILGSHSLHSEMQGLPAYDAIPFRFCFIRNPINWYKSYWAYKMTYHWSKKVAIKCDELDVFCKHDKFETFIENVAQRYPQGFYKPLIAEYQQGCDYVGRYEHLREDLITALGLAGETYNSELIMKFKVRNASSKKYKSVPISNATIQLIRKFEGLQIKSQ